MDRVRRFKVKGQVSIEFVVSVVVTMAFIGLVTQLFLWFCGNVVNRHEAFERTRSVGNGNAPSPNFYDQESNRLRLRY